MNKKAVYRSLKSIMYYRFGIELPAFKEANFQEKLRLNAFQRVELSHDIEEVFDVVLSNHDFLKFQSVEELLTCIIKSMRLELAS